MNLVSIKTVMSIKSVVSVKRVMTVKSVVSIESVMSVKSIKSVMSVRKKGRFDPLSGILTICVVKARTPVACSFSNNDLL